MNIIRSESGQSLIEFALMLPILCLLVLGMVNYSLRIQAAMAIEEAASAGAAYGTIPGNERDLSGMQSAATNASPGVSGMTVNASQLWACTPGGSPVASSSSCPNYGTPIQYVQVRTSASVPALISWPGISAPVTIQQTATYRVPWLP